MLGKNQILRIAAKVAKANLTHSNFSSVVTEPTIDSEGREALRITIVIKPGAVARISGDAALDTLSASSLPGLTRQSINLA